MARSSNREPTGNPLRTQSRRFLVTFALDPEKIFNKKMELNNMYDTKNLLKNGKIVRWPKKYLERCAILEFIAYKIPKEVKLSEKEVNNIIKENIIFDDYVLIRRELIEHKYVQRTIDCREYWRTI
jgi:hypothetical protein